MSARSIVPVILSGGSGTRLWPLSRADRPKQFLDLAGDTSMLRATVDRLGGIPGLGPPVVVTNADHAHLVRRRLEGLDARLVLEPVGRNTAPAAAAAALLLRSDDATLLVLPADHVIEQVAPLKEAVLGGADLAEAGKLVTFGIVPSYPETGYGYIRAASAIDDTAAFDVAAFVEKPDAETADEYVASGDYFWNSGMFMFTAERYLRELHRWAPEIFAAVEQAAGAPAADRVLSLDPEAFASCPSDSIDFAVMEHTQDAAVIPLDAGWSDVGSWLALWELLPHDEEENAAHGDVTLIDTRRSLAWSENRLVTAVGIEDTLIVDTDDALLVAPLASSQEVKSLVNGLRDAGRPEADRSTTLEHRPWGTYETLADGDGYRVKRLTVDPGERLPLQSHRHRAEEWTVVKGTASITVDGDESTIPEGQTVTLPIGARHQVANPGRIPLVVIEVQVGSYVEDNDSYPEDGDVSRNAPNRERNEP